jgi:hypothetical protein
MSNQLVLSTVTKTHVLLFYNEFGNLNACIDIIVVKVSNDLIFAKTS